MSGEWILNDLKGSPHRIRPETHWFTETTKKVRDDGALWFSLRLTRHRAKLQMGPKRDFRRTHRSPCTDDADRPHGIEVRTGRAKVGHDWHRHPRSRGGVRRALEALPAQGIEISDVGLAVAGESTVRKDAEYLPPAIAETAQSTPRAIPEGSPVIIATIDDGIGIAEPSLPPGADQTRVRHFLIWR